MKKLTIVRGYHPLERTAVILAKRIAGRLKTDDYDVEEIRMPKQYSHLYSLMHDTSSLTSRKKWEIMEVAHKWRMNLDQQYSDRIIIDFHNSNYNPKHKSVEEFGFSEWEDGPVTEIMTIQHYDDAGSHKLNGFTLEIPAIYNKILTNPKILHNINLMREKGLLSSRWDERYCTHVVDIKKSKERGLLSQRIENLILECIKYNLNQQHRL